MNLITAALDNDFSLLHQNSVAFLRAISPDLLYRQPRAATSTMPIYSPGEHLLRSAAVVEQAFGGITANLWDDPFEWTLPEALSTAAKVEEYLEEVEQTRRRGFALILTDDDLSRHIGVPAGGTAPIFQVISKALWRAAHHQGRAFAALRMLSDARLPVV
jgi:hypothetical protein